MECKHSEIRSEVREQVRSVSERSYGPYLPNRDQLVAHFRGPTMEDTVGVSSSDYADVDPLVRDIFFVDESTLVDAETAVANALASPLLNVPGGTMYGDADFGVVLYRNGSQPVEAAERRLWRYVLGVQFEPLYVDSEVLVIDNYPLYIEV